MQILFSSQSPERGVVGVGVFHSLLLTAYGQELDRLTQGLLEKSFKNSHFKGKLKEVHSLLPATQVAFDRLICLGLGEKDKLTEAQAYEIGGALTLHLQRTPHESAMICLEDLPLEKIVAIAFGALLRAWRFDKYKTQLKPEEKPALARLTFRVDDPEKAQDLFQEFQFLAEGIHWSRTLISEPGNVIYPQTLAEEAKKLTAVGVTVEGLDEPTLKKLGMNALLGVACGSDKPPYLVVMRWEGAANKTESPLAFVGKGVTFDTGGISIKPANNMDEMKGDMGGAGVVMGLMQTLARRKAAVNAVGVIALVENMPSGKAQRPGDIVVSMSGQTIEVLNTDAEGRLILADALWYTQDRFKPRFIVDLATLTGAMRVALADEYAGLFSNDDTLVAQLIQAGEDVGERLWRLPLGEGYDKAINSPVADMQNIAVAGFGAGSITAAQFLQRFVNKTPWAHLDIAAVDTAGKDTSLCPKGATAFGVRLLNRWVKSQEVCG